MQRALPEGLAARLVAPRGPLREGRGRAWIGAFAADPDDALSAALAPAAAGVAAFIGALRERVPTAGRPIVVGISQGGLVALALAARDPHAVGAVFVLGATLPRGLWPRATPMDPPRVWGWHGARDRYVPLRRTEVAFAAFRRRGYGAELEVDERRGHRFDGPARGALRAALARFVDASVREGGAAGRAPRRGRGPRDALGRAGGRGGRPREGRASGSGASR
ncbi:MAG: hypothetical protein CMN29_20500 [Sandaracinus sp.]|nr:hypothetical protein [Sandaracinus sp.]